VGSSREEIPLSTSVAIGVRPKNSKPPVKLAATVRVSDPTIEGLTDIFGMLADKSRLKILLALGQEGEMNVTALCELLGQSQPAVSHHLTLLRMNQLVRFRRDGKHNYYRVNSALVCRLLENFFSDAGNNPRQIQFDEFCIAFKRK
jgi:ArsR family transcriptional regulator